MELRAFFLALGAALFFSSVRADEVSLPGSAVSVDRATAKAVAIFSGKLLNVGPASFPSGGQSGYYGNQIRVVRRLSGSLGMLATVSFFTRDEAGEEAPEAGGTYIFFVSRNGTGDLDPFTAFKIVPSTRDNLTAVKASLKGRGKKRFWDGF